jgi:hypothetical protein
MNNIVKIGGVLNTCLYCLTEHIEDEKRGGGLSGWKLLAVIILAIIGLGVCAIVAFIIFSKNQDCQMCVFNRCIGNV